MHEIRKLSAIFSKSGKGLSIGGGRWDLSYKTSIKISGKEIAKSGRRAK